MYYMNMTAKIQTCSDTEIWLFESRRASLTESFELPSKRKILEIYLHLSEKRTVRESSIALPDMIIDL
jgi:hypothetical protein